MLGMGISVRQDARGAWGVFIRDDRGRRSRFFGQGEEAERRARRFAEIAEIDAGRRESWLVGSAMPCATVLRGWLATYGPTLARSTHETANGLIETHLVPAFGDTDLRHLSEPDLIAFVDARMRAGKSAALCLNALSVLRRVCELHVRAGHLAANPARGVKRLVARVAKQHEAPKRAVDSWTRAEVSELLAAATAREPSVAPALVLAFGTGMRRGEILALEWADVDFARARITVRQSLVRRRVSVPKSGRERVVPMSPGLADVLSEHRAAQRHAQPWVPPELVCPAPRGGIYDETNFARAWRRLRDYESMGARPLPFHCARHTFATMALEAGRSVKWLADVLGHADPTITLRTYAHALPTEAGALDFVPVGRGTQMARNGTQPSRTAGSDKR